jgi:hypothetical protein
MIHVALPLGERTLYHSHTRDRIAIDLSAASIKQQKMNEPEGPATPTKPGNISALTLTDASYTHRVHNVGTAPYEVLDIEPDHRPTIPSPEAAAPVAAENPSARVYSWVLAPGASSPMHTHMRPYIVVSVTPMNAPWAVERNRRASVPDIAAGMATRFSPTTTLIAVFSHRF